ncbi:S8 family serine peptidase [Aquimarina agarilytica]|uniref:S8 family serine peptidase n=1 Tax=Aquimarina agarilytica TaxID=1087449 RepID=UPI000288AFED|nr:S8 family serine peptidase [Aquimarina agarilytica]
MAQDYQLTENQKQKINFNRNNTKLDPLFNEIINKGNSDKYIHFVANPNTTCKELKKSLIQIGAKDCIVLNHIVCGKIKGSDLEKVNRLSQLKSIIPLERGETNSGVVKTEGDELIFSDIVRKDFGFDGSGIKIGVISDSYNRLGGAAEGVANGDLPGIGNPNGYTKPVQVLRDDPIFDDEFDGDDEGRAMLEIVHDIAPGAELYFYSGVENIFSMADGVRALADAGCHIIVDDLSYNFSNYFMNGPVGLAINDVVSKGAIYFSSVGNRGRSSYQAPYKDSGKKGPNDGKLHDFGNGETVLRIQVPPLKTVTLYFQWEDTQPTLSEIRLPFTKTDIDFYAFDTQTGELITSSNRPNIRFLENFEQISINNTSILPRNVDLLIELKEGRIPRMLKFIDRFDNVIFTTNKNTFAGTASGHRNAEGCISVGASSFFNHPNFNDYREEAGLEKLDLIKINGFSSAGGTPKMLDDLGNFIAPIVPEVPFIVGPDGGQNSFFGLNGPRTFDDDIILRSEFKRFYGSSASAPHVAAATALLLQADNTLTSSEVKDILKETATDMDDPITAEFDTGFDYGTGYGYLNILKAIEKVTDGNTLSATDNYKNYRETTAQVDVYPTLFESELSLNLKNVNSGYYTVQIFNIQGKIVFSNVYDVKSNNFNTKLNLEKYPSAPLILTIKNKNSGELVHNQIVFKK